MNDAKQSYRKLRLRARRKIRRQKKSVEEAAIQADNSLERLVFKRFNRLVKVRRFVAVWVVLVFFIGFGAVWQVQGLDKYYLKLEPTSGGIYREGQIGSFTTANPLFASSPVDVSVSRLVFSGLFKLSPDGSLDSDLASKYSVDERGLVYKVTLREDVVWHDGEGFNSEDVIFTYDKIRSPEVDSPLFSSWRDVSIKADGDYTVTFTLPNPLASFHLSMTNGIIPQHVLGGVEEADLRSSLFNTETAVGTGPFTFESVEVVGDDIEELQEKVTLETYPEYYDQSARIDGVVIRTYADEDDLLSAFIDQEIVSMVGLRQLPEDLKDDNTVRSISTPMLSSVMIFFNNSNVALSDKNVRKALTLATDTAALRKSLGYELLEVDSPFLRTHFSYNKDKTQLEYNPAEAAKILDEAGWKIRESGKREKDGAGLRIRLVSQSLSEYTTIVQGIQQQWNDLGVEVDAVLQPEEDIQVGAVSRHDYDALLYGIAIGSDPDVFAYWHSSQADQRLRSRLNLSEYDNDEVDAALEAGRTRLDEDLRSVKYEPFLDSWREDAPAVGLYQPRFLFITRGTLEGYRTGQFSNTADRFFSITDWQVRSRKTIK